LEAILKNKNMDNTANFISAIQNAQRREKNSLILPFSVQTQKILNILFVEGYIKGFKILRTNWYDKKINNQNLQQNYKKINYYKMSIEVFFKYSENTKNQEFNFQIKKISKSSKKMYTASKNINKIKRGLGSLILSTSKGILIDRDARYLKIGGEPLCIIY
jgi:small subunit ribosomal protein S8